MKPWARCLSGVIAVVAVLAAAVGTDAETFTLQLKRIDSVMSFEGTPPESHVLRMVRPQIFSMWPGVIFVDGGVAAIPALPSSPAAGFSAVVTKEIEEYNSEHPFRGAARLGSGQYGFVLDTNDAESIDYCRLHFDLNHNGDLTDDEVINGKRPPGEVREGYSRYEFPRVDLTIDAEGTKIDYAFFFSAYSQVVDSRRGGIYFFSARLPDPTSRNESKESEKAEESKKAVLVSARLTAAAYREGEVTLDGKSHRIALVDCNSNGRFDDEVTVRKSTSGRASVRYGDIVLVDVDPRDELLPSNGDSPGSPVAKLLAIGGGFYEMEVAPGGDKVTLSPSPVSHGHVTISTDGFQGTVYSDTGVVNIKGDKSEAVPVPVGDWNLASYTIDLTNRWEPSDEQKATSEESSLLKGLASAPLADAGSRLQRPPTTRIRAYGYESQVMKVREGETIACPFGPPYRPVVTAGDSPSVKGGQQVRLAMSLIGSGGETCRSLSVNGGRPPQPEFTISTPNGDVIASGRFKWG